VFSIAPSCQTTTLPAFAAERRAAAPLLLSDDASCITPAGVPGSIDRYLLPAGRSAANPLHAGAAVDRFDGTD